MGKQICLTPRAPVSPSVTGENRNRERGTRDSARQRDSALGSGSQKVPYVLVNSKNSSAHISITRDEGSEISSDLNSGR
jgi:hypothetical protein